jgi:hypothetical protein
MYQVRNDLLSRISRLRVPAEFGATEVSRREMDEVGTHASHQYDARSSEPTRL